MAKKDSKKAAAPQEKPPIPRLLEAYKTQILPELAKKVGRSNPHALPRILKIAINMGVGTATVEKKHLEDAVAALAQIAAQKPLVTKSRIAVAGFKLRENQPIGCK